MAAAGCLKSNSFRITRILFKRSLSLLDWLKALSPLRSDWPQRLRVRLLPPDARSATCLFTTSELMTVDTPFQCEGAELKNLVAAKCEAVKLAGRLICDAGDTFWDRAEWQLTVTDQVGLTLFDLNFHGWESAAVRLMPLCDVEHVGLAAYSTPGEPPRISPL
jgi:hypothetical protein